MTHLLRAWRSVAPRFRPPRRVAVLLDYDGTLAAIAPTPAQAKLTAPIRSSLRVLSRQPATVVGIISGRPLRDVQRCVGIPGLVYAGNHGLELRGPRLAFVHPAAARSRRFLRVLAGQLDAALRAIPGAWTEWKGLTISLHWRHVPSGAQARFHRLVETLTAPHVRRGKIRLTVGKRVVEIRPPVQWDKGAMVEWLARHLPKDRGRYVALCYAGDDHTDEDAFRAVNRLRGLSVFVGGPSRTTAATHWLSGPQEVSDWLQRLSRLRQDPGSSKEA